MTHNDKGLQFLFVDMIKDMHDAESQIIEALPMMEKAATSSDLKQAFRQHLDQTRSQIDRLERVARNQGIEYTGKKCVGMQGVIKEGQEILKEDLPTDVKDAGLIAAAQKVEHYEIASYGTLTTYAQMLGFDEAARVFDQIAKEEGETDQKLTMLAESHINREAIHKQQGQR